MKNTKLIAAFVIGLLAAVGCKSEYELLLEGNDVDAK